MSDETRGGPLSADRDAPVGGQAVMEGVMMRGVSAWAVAVRTPDGGVEVRSSPLVPWRRHRALRWPVVRGVVALAESLTTREPDREQLGVAIAALEAVLAVEDPRAAAGQAGVGMKMVA